MSEAKEDEEEMIHGLITVRPLRLIPEYSCDGIIILRKDDRMATFRYSFWMLNDETYRVFFFYDLDSLRNRPVFWANVSRSGGCIEINSAKDRGLTDRERMLVAAFDVLAGTYIFTRMLGPWKTPTAKDMDHLKYYISDFVLEELNKSVSAFTKDYQSTSMARLVDTLDRMNF
jgi:hypothetical protein